MPGSLPPSNSSTPVLIDQMVRLMSADERALHPSHRIARRCLLGALLALDDGGLEVARRNLEAFRTAMRASAA